MKVITSGQASEIKFLSTLSSYNEEVYDVYKVNKEEWDKNIRKPIKTVLKQFGIKIKDLTEINRETCDLSVILSGAKFRNRKGKIQPELPTLEIDVFVNAICKLAKEREIPAEKAERICAELTYQLKKHAIKNGKGKWVCKINFMPKFEEFRKIENERDEESDFHIETLIVKSEAIEDLREFLPDMDTCGLWLIRRRLYTYITLFSSGNRRKYYLDILDIYAHLSDSWKIRLNDTLSAIYNKFNMLGDAVKFSNSIDGERLSNMKSLSELCKFAAKDLSGCQIDFNNVDKQQTSEEILKALESEEYNGWDVDYFAENIERIATVDEEDFMFLSKYCFLSASSVHLKNLFDFWLEILDEEPAILKEYRDKRSELKSRLLDLFNIFCPVS
jgi:hypothetical protein